MNCDEYLSMLETQSVDEMTQGRAREHAAGCADCNRVTVLVAERERHMLEAFFDIHSSALAEQTAASAVTTSRVRRRASGRRVVFAVAMVVVIAGLVSRLVPQSGGAVEVSTEAFALRCLSTKQATALLRPIIDRTARIVSRPNTPGIITITAAADELAAARRAIAEFDALPAACGVPVTGGVPATKSK